MYYRIQNGTLFEDFENINDWTLSGAGASITADTTNFKTGSQGIKVTSVNNVSAYITKTINQSFNNVNSFVLWLYIDDVTKYSSSNVALLYLSSTSDFSKSMTTGNILASINTSVGLKTGWNKIILGKGDFSALGGEVWSNTMIRLRLRTLSATDATVNVTFDSLYISEYSRPKCIISFDDGSDTVYSVAYPCMRAKGFRGVTFCPMSPDRLGTTGVMSLDNLRELYNYGWDISGHSYTHVDLTSVSLEQARTELQNEISALLANGFTRAAYDMAWPFSALNSDLLALCRQLGFRTCRTGNDRVQCHTYNDPLQLARYEITTSRTLTDYKTQIQSAIASGCLIYLNLHIIRTPTSQSTDMTIADFQALINYLASIKEQIDVVTLSEWYNGLISPRKLV